MLPIKFTPPPQVIMWLPNSPSPACSPAIDPPPKYMVPCSYCMSMHVIAAYSQRCYACPCMSTHVHVACSWCMSLQHVLAVRPCYMSSQHVHAACPSFMLMFHVQNACPCWIVHALCSYLMPILSMIHTHCSRSRRRAEKVDKRM